MTATWKCLAVAAVAAATSVWATPAGAHVTANPNQAAPGGFAFVEFRIGHGCEASPTVEVAVQIPEEVVSVTPEVMDGWAIEVVREESAASGDEGRVTEVRWTGNLPSDRVDHFGLSMRFADDVDAPAVMFPTVQTCGEGEHRWVDVPSDPAEAVTFFGEAESPAPYVLLEGEKTEVEAASSAAAERADEKRLTAEPAAIEGDADSDALSTVALGVGVLALMVGAAALVRAGAASREVSQP